MKRAVVLLSGGLDSTTALAVAQRDGFEACAMTFRYGQRHEIEVDAARRVARAARVEDHVIVDIDLRTFGASAITGDAAVPKDRPLGEPGVPITYVPARNTIFLSFALAWAEVLGTGDIYVAINAVDYSGYPDCRPEYIAAFEHMARLATRAGIEGRSVHIHTPLIQLSKADIIRLGTSLGVDYALTSSCYDPTVHGVACGRCDSCRLRLKGFAEAGLEDPIRYREPRAQSREPA
jgi:7-cyano-7-deazaguanine synthase